MKTRKVNGKIEALRFLFCVGVLLFHGLKYFIGEPSAKQVVHLSLFPHGAIGVEFFSLYQDFLWLSQLLKYIVQVLKKVRLVQLQFAI